MTLGRTLAVTLHGLAGTIVDVECHLSAGLPFLGVSGLPDTACGQAPDRIRSAAAMSAAPLPSHRIVVNLSPASIPKHGTGFDVAIAVAILSASGTIRAPRADRIVHIGELGLDGRLRGVRGVLPMVLAAARADAQAVVVPPDNLAEAQLVDGIAVHSPSTLAELLGWYSLDAATGCGLPLADPVSPADADPGRTIDLADVVGQPEARQALELAAVGGHHLLMMGPPGVGKTMLAERLVTILPKLTREEALESHAIRSLVGLSSGSARLDRTPPFEAPHHSATLAAIAGGGSSAVLPGAISRAHAGVLFLDEAPEFASTVLQALRQPLESGFVTIGRARSSTTYPARFILAMAANPCPCGHKWGTGASCSCSPLNQRRYAARLSGPLLDRVDIRVVVPPVPRGAFAAEVGESSDVVRARVERAREVQRERWGPVGHTLNGRVPGTVLRRRPFRLLPRVTRDLDAMIDRGDLSLRGYDRVLRLAWSSADLRGAGIPTRDDVSQAILLRDEGLAA